MATVNKDFRIKSGLVVEGANGTINGSNIITEDAISGGTQTNISVTYDANSGVINFVAENGFADSTTSDLVEGANLYFTDERARAAISVDGSGPLSYNSSTGELDLRISSGSPIRVNASDNGLGLNKDLIDSWYDSAGAAAAAESNANAYTDTTVNGLTTSDIEEGTNLYFTDARAQTAVADNIATAKTTAIASAAQDATTKADAALASANLYTDGKVSDLVGAAPELLNTLNELAAAIGDDANYATTVTNLVATKADTSYVDANFVNVADLPGQLDEYVPLTQKAQPDGVATLDSAGAIPIGQISTSSIHPNVITGVLSKHESLRTYPGAENDSLGINRAVVDEWYEPAGAVASAVSALSTADVPEYVESGRLYFTDERAVAAIEAVVPSFTAVEVGAVAKQIAATSSAFATLPSVAYSWAKSEYRSAEFLVKVSFGTHTEISKVLLTLDTADNIAISEYGVVGTNGSLSDISAQITGSNVELVVVSGNDSQITVSGTLLA